MAKFEGNMTRILDDDTFEDLAIQDSDIYKINGGGVGLSYDLNDLGETGRTPSNYTVNTWVDCTMFRLDSRRYWKDYEGSKRTSRGMLYKSRGWFTHGRCYKGFH